MLFKNVDFEVADRPGKRYFTLREASRYLGVDKSLLTKDVMDGNIAYYKLSEKSIGFRIDDLENWMENKRVPTEYEAMIKSWDTV